MIIQKPKTLYWTHHSRAKMRQYGLSEARVKRVIHSPKRTEEGIAPKTVGMMQPASTRTLVGRGGPSFKNGKREETWKQEIWVMIQEEKQRRKVISAWRYPGKTKPREPLPEGILREIREAL
ncbi:hypothetical protein C4571_03730 [Candidatus Parcubacteria bacterium]|nr:MAG: hypothetical protein C4571_03730 [Candidatus Parcubacteria bacterium]